MPLGCLRKVCGAAVLPLLFLVTLGTSVQLEKLLELRIEVHFHVRQLEEGSSRFFTSMYNKKRVLDVLNVLKDIQPMD